MTIAATRRRNQIVCQRRQSFALTFCAQRYSIANVLSLDEAGFAQACSKCGNDIVARAG